MVQTIDHIALKTLISNTLSSVLGTYTFSNGVTTPAIWVEGVPNTAGEKPLQAEGLEVVIVINTDTDYTPWLAGEYESSQISEIILKQWDATKDTNVARNLLLETPAIQKLITAIQPRVLPFADFGNIEQQTILLRHF